MLRFVLFLILAIGSIPNASAATVRITDGDCNGLSAAVAIAAQNVDTASSTTILLARAGNYVGCSFRMGTGKLIIDGQGAHLQQFSACLFQDYLIPNPNPQATPLPLPSLELRNLTITGGAAQSNTCAVWVGDMNPIFPTHYVLDNVGSVTLNTVTLTGSTSVLSDGFIRSSGNLVFRNVSVVGVSVNASSILAALQGPNGALISNSGNLEIYNSTFANNSARITDPVTQASSATFLINSNGLLQRARVLIGNSLFAGNGTYVCNPSLPAWASPSDFVSLGGNVTTSAICGIPASSDKMVTDANLAELGNHGGLVPTQAISGGSPAKGAGNPQYCEALDARGYTRSPHGCDAGAYEYGGGSGALTASGMNGVYYDPDANGHYVSLQRIHDNGDIAIVWSTFDANGNQAWVYGVGQLTDKRIHANMSQNIGGVLQVGGAPTGSSVRPWGTVDIDLTSCASAQFNYASTLDGFGSGQFPLTRLAFVSDFGCAE